MDDDVYGTNTSNLLIFENPSYVKVNSPDKILMLLISIKYSTGVADQKPTISVSQFLVVTGVIDGVGVCVCVCVGVDVFVDV